MGVGRSLLKEGVKSLKLITDKVFTNSTQGIMTHAVFSTRAKQTEVGVSAKALGNTACVLTVLSASGQEAERRGRLFPRKIKSTLIALIPELNW